MIMKMNCICTLSGKNFVPSELYESILPSITILSSIEVGTLHDIGRYKGQPADEGILSVEGDIDSMLSFLEKFYFSETKKKIEYIDVTINVAFDNQCNFELTSYQLKRLSQLDIVVGITCYQSEISD